MNEETKQKTKTRIYVLSLVAMFVLGMIVCHVLFSDDSENEDIEEAVPTPAYECDYCHDIDTVIIIVLEDNVPIAKAFPCPYHDIGGVA